MLNDLDRYHLVIDVIDRVPHLGSKAAGLRQRMVDQRIHAREYTRTYGEDIPEVDRKSTRLNSSHANISYAVFCLKKKTPMSPAYPSSLSSGAKKVVSPLMLVGVLCDTGAHADCNYLILSL